jgi:hypothetical protein
MAKSHEQRCVIVQSLVHFGAHLNDFTYRTAVIFGGKGIIM